MTKPTLYRNLHPHQPHSLVDIFRWKFGIDPPDPPAVIPDDLALPVTWSAAAPAESQPEDLRVTWIGHSTFLIQHLGLNILTDPIFGDCPPWRFASLKRLQPPGLALADLPKIDIVLISHAHYDHLDADAIGFLGAGPRYFVPSGLASWFQRRGIESVTEVAWWDSTQISPEITLTSVPAQHGAARTPFDRDKTHWCGWVLESLAKPEDSGDSESSACTTRRIYFAGDTGYSPIFREIGQRFGGFDLAMIPIGCYNPRWLMQPVHLNPADAVQVHIDVRSQQSIACHWGTFRLADEPLAEPPALLTHELAEARIDPSTFRAIQPGDSLEM